jgi:hypothetical protein
MMMNWLKLPTNSRWAWLYFLMFGGAYSVLCIFGALTANNKILSLMWPANPFMLGMLARFPSLAGPLGRVACLAGFAIAIPVIGCGLNKRGLAAYATWSSAMAAVQGRSDRPASPAPDFGFLPTLCGGRRVQICRRRGRNSDRPLFRDPVAVSSFRYWFSVELLNQRFCRSSCPTRKAVNGGGGNCRSRPSKIKRRLLCWFSPPSPGSFGMAALVFPVPALLWCAISYRVFLTTH